ncbi:MAG: cytochrome c [Solirubrobacterales bacterium]|nr:cytochrome c [Solirubrobacterales bacterium]MCB0860518.1 cytochrome c [Solirubrobacterales bacterium]HRV59101.1 cytochrome c [Solirubrobacterales bacterium]
MKKFLLLLSIVPIAIAGCGGSDEGSPSGAKTAGAELFNSAGCAGCHALSEADANGPVGPDLDGLKLDEQRVQEQIENGGGSMPSFKGRLTPAEIDRLARFVSRASQS